MAGSKQNFEASLTKLEKIVEQLESEEEFWKSHFGCLKRELKHQRNARNH